MSTHGSNVGWFKLVYFTTDGSEEEYNGNWVRFTVNYHSQQINTGPGVLPMVTLFEDI